MASQYPVVEHRLEGSGSGDGPRSFATEGHFKQSPVGAQLFQVAQPPAALCHRSQKHLRMCRRIQPSKSKMLRRSSARP